MTNITCDYDHDTDFLEVSDTDASDNYKFSINVGEMGINVAHNDDIMSVEIMNASQVFDIPPNQLEELNDVDIEIERRGPVSVIKVRLTYDNGQQSSQYGVSIDKHDLSQAPA